MKTYCVSDIHADHYVSENESHESTFDRIYDTGFLPAEACCIAGDIADTVDIYVEFVEYISAKYAKVYIVFGNHDLDAYYQNPEYHIETSIDKMVTIAKLIGRLPNVYLLDGSIVDGIAGTMGMCDCEYEFLPFASVYYNRYHWREWYDNSIWKYMDNDPAVIWKVESGKMKNVACEATRLMMTHFAPVEMGVSPRYVDDRDTPYFVFTGRPFLNTLGCSFWLCGHTHTAWKTNYERPDGTSVTIMCNPYGYPSGMDPYLENRLSRSDFLIDL